MKKHKSVQNKSGAAKSLMIASLLVKFSFILQGIIRLFASMKTKGIISETNSANTFQLNKNLYKKSTVPDVLFKTTMVSVLFFAFILTGMKANAQGEQAKFYGLVSKSDSLYAAGDFMAAGLAMSDAFKVSETIGDVYIHYNAACCWALAGVPDSAFSQLNFITFFRAFTDYNQMMIDKDFASIRTDKRWQIVIEAILHNRDSAESNMNQPLKRELETILNDDQIYRQKLRGVGKTYGMKSNEYTQLCDTINFIDSINLKKVIAILETIGWPCVSDVGREGVSTVFLVIQHSDLAVQEKYLPMMRNAVKEKNMSPSSLALLEDRVALGEGKKQIYGSQIGYNDSTATYFIFPIEDEFHVNIRREEVGLEPLEEYVKNWDIVYLLPKEITVNTEE